MRMVFPGKHSLLAVGAMTAWLALIPAALAEQAAAASSKACGGIIYLTFDTGSQPVTSGVHRPDPAPSSHQGHVLHGQ